MFIQKPPLHDMGEGEGNVEGHEFAILNATPRGLLQVQSSCIISKRIRIYILDVYSILNWRKSNITA